MAVLLLRLAGPMQSWGTQSRFSVRDTGREPSKSGVVGLLCAALGTPRDDEAGIARIAAMRMGVRVDHEGTVASDFHTAGGGTIPGRGKYGVFKASGASPSTVTSTRYYLADAVFLVGLESDDRAFLERLDRALADPCWPLFLGRKSFVPAAPLRLGVHDQGLEDMLRTWPWRPLVRSRPEPPDHGLRMMLDSDDPTDLARYDSPVSFRKDARRFELRYVTISRVSPSEIIKEGAPCTYPD